MLRFCLVIFLLATVAGVSACGTRLVAIPTPPEQYPRFSTFYTPTHDFECSWGGGGTMIARFVPGTIYGAFDFGRFNYEVTHNNGWGTEKGESGIFQKHVIGLHVREMYTFAAIFPDGEFISENYPIVYADLKLEKVTMEQRYNWTCNHVDGQPPFKQIDPWTAKR